jgi:hypothetical protein
MSKTDPARYRELARLARSDARRSTTPETRRILLAKAAAYDRDAEAAERPDRVPDEG